MTAPTKEDVIKMLMQLRKTLAHALTQPNISPKRFNDIREQLLPLDVQLNNLGVELEPAPQQHHVKLTRYQKRKRNRDSKHSSYEARVRHKLAHSKIDNALADMADDIN
jgi:hypothetical protein